MKKEHLVFLFGGFAFGFLFGFGLFHVLDNRPDLSGQAVASAGIPQPQGPMAPTQAGPQAQGGAPMVAEVNRLKARLQENPEDVTVLARLAHMHHDAAMWEQAVGYYERALELRPDDADLITDLGICYRAMRQPEKALELFGRAQAADPSHWQSLFNTVVVASFDLNRFDVALEALESMEAMDPRPDNLDESRLVQLREALEQAMARQQGGEKPS